MNWLNNLLGKAPATTPGSGREPPKRALPLAPAPVDLDALRRGVAEAQGAARVAAEQALGEALGARSLAPADGDGQAVWVAAIAHAADKAQAASWLLRLETEESLATVACDGRFAELRLAAAQRLQASDWLEHVARASKNKDKGVYRHCSDLLRARRDSAERARLAAALAEGLEQLLARTPVSVSHLLELERGLKALEPAAGQADPALARCRELLAQANARVLEESAAQRTLPALAAGAAALAADIDAAGWQPDALPGWSQRCAALLDQAAALPPWLAATAPGRALADSAQALERRLRALACDAEHCVAASQLLDSAGPGPADAALAAAWEALPKPENRAALEPLQARWLALQAPPSDPPQAPMPAADPEPIAPEPATHQPALPPLDTDKVRSLIDSLEQDIDNGQLALAEAAGRHLKAELGAHALEGRLDARLQRAQARLASLRDWAQWGANKKRDDLIEAALQLQSQVQAGTHNVEHLAVAIPALREEWRRLNTQGASSKAQWEHFDKALEYAYQPVAVLRAEEAQRRALARAGREALLAGFDAALGAIDWEHPDAGAIDGLREQMLAQWRAGPFAGYRDERALRTRFDALLLALDERVQSLRAAEVARREALIEAVVALRELSDLRQATSQAKALQERWRTEVGPIRLRRGEEQKLWQRFRGGCDAVFARRDAERDAERARREQQQQELGARLDHFAAAIDSTQGPALRAALAQFRAEWEPGSAPPDDGAETGGALQRRARDLQRQAQQKLDALEQQAVAAHFAQLAAAAPSVEGLAAEVLEAGRQKRQALLIDLEIVLGLASPQASAQARRQRQLEQLQSRFRPGAAPAPVEQDPEKLLRQWYCQAAAADADQDQRIAAVVEKLRQQRLAPTAARVGARDKSAAERPRTAPRPGTRPPAPRPRRHGGDAPG